MRRQCHGTDCCSGSSAVSSRMSHLHPALFPSLLGSPSPTATPPFVLTVGGDILFLARGHSSNNERIVDSVHQRGVEVESIYCLNFAFIFSCEGGTGCFMIQDGHFRSDHEFILIRISTLHKERSHRKEMEHSVEIRVSSRSDPRGAPAATM